MRLRFLLCGLLASVSAQTIALTGQARAQTPNNAHGGEQVEQVVVTGSRIVEEGYQAPTPVTVVSTDELLSDTPTSIANGLNGLPEFTPALTATSNSHFNVPATSGNVLDLRGLGPNRTLVLFDGMRAPATTYLNTTDVDFFPQMLIKRVDIVTAGASSAYGSDAVAGVVNYVLDSNFTGVKALMQGGISTYGDDGSERVGVAVGTGVTGRDHLLLSLDFSNDDGFLYQDRPKLDNNGMAVGSVLGGSAPGTVGNPYVQIAPVSSSFYAYGGQATTGPFAGTVFLTPGVYRPAIKGTPTGSSGDYTGTSDYGHQSGLISAGAAVRSVNAFGRYSYDISDDTTAYVELMGADTETKYNATPNLLIFPAATIFSGNAYLPAALQAQMTASNTPSFTLTKLFNEWGPNKVREGLENVYGVAGIKGDLDKFHWDVNYSYGSSIDHLSDSNDLNWTNFAAAVDAVVNPASGNIVCNASLSTNPTVAARYANCAPLNLFGYGASSAAAQNYVTGTSAFRAANSRNDITANLTGELFSLSAGPVSGAIGAEYRWETLNLTSNSNPAVADNITGLRGILPSAPAFYLTDQGTANGSQNVKEAYAELAVPVLKDSLIGDVDTNGAFRFTDYSTSGKVSTWKVGGTWAPIEDLRFRVTRSRDIRAPTLYDLFAGAQFAQGAAADPHTGTLAAYNQITSGNPNLKPEVGDTFTPGVVYQPSYLPNFMISVDYYDTTIHGAIATLPALSILQTCEASNGTSPICGDITRPFPFSNHTAANSATQITVSGINVASIATDGIDVNATYKTSVFGGDLTSHLYANYVPSFKTELTSAQPFIQYVGYNASGSGGVTGPIPHFRASANINYDIDRYSIFLQENMIGSLTQGMPGQVYVDPSIPPYLTTDTTLTYHLNEFGADEGLFLSVKNIFNKTPPLVESTAVPGFLSTILTAYPITGREFVGGLRLQF